MLIVTLHLHCVKRMFFLMQKISRVNKNRRALNKCNHRLSRKGYVGLMKEIVSLYILV